MKPTSGTFSTYLSNLRVAGYLDEQDGLLQLTDDGRTALDAGQTTELVEVWQEQGTAV